MHYPRVIAVLIAAVVAGHAAESVHADAQPPGSAPTPAPAPAPAPAPTPAPASDPTAAVLAQGHFIYRERDLDALMLVAQRHSHHLSRGDVMRLRQVLLQCLLAREALLDEIGAFPAGLSGPGRDAMILDLLDYQAEAATVRTLPPGETTGAPAAGALPGPGPGPSPAISSTDHSVLVPLPVLTLTRTLDGIGRRQLAVGLALNFKDAAQAKAFEAKAPIIEDAILGYVQHLPGPQFAEPDQTVLKNGLTRTVISRIADFPADGILIPQLEVTVPEASTPSPAAR